MSKSSPYLNGVAAARVISCYLVICLHTFPPEKNLHWLIENLYLGTFCRGAVPFFFAASGYFFALGPGKSGFNRKTSCKLLQLAVFWMIAGLLTRLLLGTLSKFNSPRAIAEFAYQTLVGGGYHHLWFLSSLFYINAWVSFTVGRFSVRVALVVSIILYSLAVAGGIYSTNSGFDIPGAPRDFIWYGSLPYCIGWLMAAKPKYRGSFSTGCLITIAASVIHLVSPGSAGISIDFVESTFALGVGFFMMALHLNVGDWIRTVGKHTLGVYCLHGLLLAFTPIQLINPNGSALIAFLAAAIVYVISYACCMMLAKTGSGRFVG